MIRRHAAFTLIEVLGVVTALGLLLAVLLPMASRARNASGLTESIHNVALLMVATHHFHAEHAGQPPMRACGYSNGQITGGWDTWNFGGKNCDVFWNNYGGGIFDEPAYAPLNAYVYNTRMHVPVGYVSTPTLFVHGHPTAADRAAVQIPLFRSPGDVATRQRNWPIPTPGVSAYNDIGTSYLQNMKWWGAPGMPTGSFTQQYVGGAQRIGLALGGATPNFVFIHDQTADAVGAGVQAMGEFGKANASVVGWADGRADYIRIVPGALFGPGYTFIP